MDVKDKVAIITGASSGIGESTAKQLGARGAAVVLAARREDRLARLQSEIGNSLAVKTDVTDEADCRRLIDLALEKYGRVDILVNNAGQGLHVPVEQIELDEYRAIMELNVYAPLRLMQLVIPIMRRQHVGVIVNISSATTKMELPGVAGYASSKCALNMLSQIARKELAGDGISVNLICPYITETEFPEKLRGTSMSRTNRAAIPAGHSPDFVAGYILQSIRTGETDIVLRPGMSPANV
jgi:short-subunit dehydrogenase